MALSRKPGLASPFLRRRKSTGGQPDCEECERQPFPGFLRVLWEMEIEERVRAYRQKELARFRGRCAHRHRFQVEPSTCTALPAATSAQQPESPSTTRHGDIPLAHGGTTTSLQDDGGAAFLEDARPRTHPPGLARMGIHLAMPDHWEARDAKLPWDLPKSIERAGPETEHTVTVRLHVDLYEAFRDFAQKHHITMQALLEGYVAWLVGADCPDTPYRIKRAVAELGRMMQEGKRFPRFLRPEVA
jgi:hypothetical protein